MNIFLVRKSGVLMLLGILVAMVLLYWFGIRVVLSKIEAGKEKIQETIALREHRERRLARLDEFAEEYDRIIREEHTLDVIIEQDRMIDFVKQLETLANENAVSIVIEARPAIKAPAPAKPKASTTTKDDEAPKESAPVKPEKKKEVGIIDTLPSYEATRLMLRVTGETARVFEYLNKVEALPFALDIISIEALRKEVSKEENKSSVANSSSQIQMSSPTIVSGQGSGQSALVSTDALEPNQSNQSVNPFTAPVDQALVRDQKPKDPFVVEVSADLVIYHVEL